MLRRYTASDRYSRDIARMLCRLRDLDREAERDDDEGLVAIGAHDQKIGAVEPRIQLAKSGAATLHLDAAIDAEQRNRNVTAEAAAGGTGERHAHSGKAGVLKGTSFSGLGRGLGVPAPGPVSLRG